MRNLSALFLVTFLAFQPPLFCTEPVPSAQQPALRAGKDFALFFAVRDYAEWEDLKNPIKDAEAVAGDLEQYYGFQTEVVRNPTRKMILDKLAEYQRRSYADDGQLLVFFSGHGFFDEAVKTGYFIPQNGKLNDPYQESYLSHLDLRRRLTAIPCRHILLMVDACFSGTLDDNLALQGGPATFGRRPGNMEEAGRQALIRDKLRNQSRFFLTSGGKERTPDGANHSPFTNQLLEGLRSFGGENGFFSFDELYFTFMSKMPAPTPLAGKFEGHEGGDFLFLYESKSSGEPEPVKLQQSKAPSDRDGDTVPDDTDQCPDVFGLAAAAGCPDADEDGVPDQSDKCKYLAGQKRWQGCPDSDGDGIPDYDDQCPDVKGAVANNGCPLAGSSAEAQKKENQTKKEAQVPAPGNAPVEKKIAQPLRQDRPAPPTTAPQTNGSDYHDVLAGDMVLVKGGTFQMGNADGNSDEHPVHQVTLSDFYIGKYEVTQAQWRRVMGAGWPETAFKGCDQCPAERVSFIDIQNFLHKLNELTGANYRLPTEAEWEYAAKGGAKSQGTSLAGGANLDEVAWWEGNSGKKTNPVGGKKPNELGLYDMNGNVWEICSDWKGDYSPEALRNPAGPASGSEHVIRGGSWRKAKSQFSNTNRHGSGHPDTRANDIGFRVARSVNN